MIVGDLRPINLVEGKHFRALINYLEPSYDLPSRHTFTKSIEDLYKNAKPSLISDLSKVTHIALTFDMWTSCRMQSFLGITVHYVSPNNAKLATALLAVKEVGEAHTGQNIASWLKTVIKDYDLSSNQIVACVTDNGSNMVSAMQLLTTEFGWVHFRCAAHTLQLCVHDCLKDEQIKRAIGKHYNNYVTC